MSENSLLRDQGVEVVTTLGIKHQKTQMTDQAQI